MSLVTHNHNCLASIDIEATGAFAGYHEIIQVAIVPLDDDLDPRDCSPFNMFIKPDHPERAQKDAMNVNGLDLAWLDTCPEKDMVANTLEEWFRDRDFPMDKRMIPLTHNGLYDIPFIKDWLGEALYYRFFTFVGRDTMEAANYMNDQAAFKARPVPFSSVGLKSLCNNFGIILDGHHDALSDALATARVYKELLRFEL